MAETYRNMYLLWQKHMEICIVMAETYIRILYDETKNKKNVSIICLLIAKLFS